MSDAALPAGIAALAMAAIVVFAAVKIGWGVALRFRPSRFRLGQQMQTETATVREWGGRGGLVDVGGELWRAEGRAEFSPGDPVRVAGKRGMLLRVKRD